MTATGSSMPIDWWRRRGKAARFDHGGPICYISLAPVEGVMPVAAAVTTMAYPMQQHVLLFDLPYESPFDGPYPAPGPHRIALDRAGEIRWDGEVTTPLELGERINNAANQIVGRPINFQPAANASYGATFEILAILGTAGDSYFCVEGMDRYRLFGRVSTSRFPTAETQDATDSAEFSPFTYCDPFLGLVRN